jgi:cellulose biosynthesis protein BcsQ
VIVGVCSEKGGPGVTTLATVLGLVLPQSPVVLEADPDGGDLMFRLRHRQTPDKEFLHTDPSVLQLAADARTGLLADGDVARYAQESTLGVRVVPAPVRSESLASMRPLWPAVAQQAAASPQVVLADLGRLKPGHAAWPMVKAATAVLVLTRREPEDLVRLRERVALLGAELGDGRRARNPVAVVLRTSVKQSRRDVEEVKLLLQAAGSPIPVAGWMADDPPGVAALRAPEPTRALRGSDLLRSVRDLAQVLTRLWPQLAGPTPADPRGRVSRPLTGSRTADSRTEEARSLLPNRGLTGRWRPTREGERETS